MGWEARGNRKYYYRKKRQGKRVVSNYLGTGSHANSVAKKVELEQNLKESELKQLIQQEAEDRILNKMLDQLESTAVVLVRVGAMLGGYYPHKGQWRRRGR